MSSTKILSIVLNNFTNDSRVLKEGVSLKKADYDVTVVALHENDLAEYELVQSLPVHRVKLTSRSWSKWKPVQFLKYMEFLFRVVTKYRNQIDIVHCNDLNALPVGVLIKKLSKRMVKIVYDAHEYETERDALSYWLKIILKFCEKRLVKHADAVLTVSDSIANCYKDDYKIEKPSLVLNCPLLTILEKKYDVFREELGIDKEKKIFLYQGGLKSGRGIEMLVEAFKQIRRDDVVIVFMGYGPLEKYIKNIRKKYNNIYFYNAVSPSILLNYTASADYGVSCIEDSCLSYRYCLPNKMFEYLMAEIPIVVSNLYEMKIIVDKNAVGVVASHNTTQGFIEAVDNILEKDYVQMLKQVKKIKGQYSWEEQEKVLLGAYASL